MADHVRKTLREAIVTSLTSLTTTGANVFDTRIYKLSQDSLPCLVVAAESEEIEELTLGGDLSRVTSFTVTAYARATASIEDTLDLIATEVELAFDPGVSAKYWTITETAFEFSGEGDNPTASMTMTFQVLYHTARTGAAL